MKFVALIPARYASTRFPGKPLALIGGKPMIQHVYERASEVFEDCFVATDDSRIADAVESFGGRVAMTGEHHRSGTDRCAEALGLAECATGKKYDVVVNIQGDEPFVRAAHLKAVASLFDDCKTQIGTLVRRFLPAEDVCDPNSPKVVTDKEGFALYFSRSVIPFVRDAGLSDIVYHKHLGLYAYRRDVLMQVAAMPQGVLEIAESLEQLRWLENGIAIKVAEVSGDSVAVDTPADLARAEEHFRSLK